MFCSYNVGDLCFGLFFQVSCVVAESQTNQLNKTDEQSSGKQLAQCNVSLNCLL